MGAKRAGIGAIGTRSGPRSAGSSIGRMTAALGGAVGGWVRLVAALQPSVLDK